MDILFWLNVIVLLQLLIILNMGRRLRNMETYMPCIGETNEIVSRFYDLFNNMANVISVEDFDKMVNQEAEVKSKLSAFESWDNPQKEKGD
jgi:truncated hemoglobin YjbI